MMELIARVKSLLRRTRPQEKNLQEFRLGDLYVRIPRHLVTLSDTPIPLTPKEFDVLVFLLQNTGIALTRDQIMSGIWGYDYDGESRTVDVHIRTLRTKFGAHADLIETVRGVGYRIGGHV
jgi:two-component system alkaline phosphatase synthesis response regulator PhoP